MTSRDTTVFVRRGGKWLAVFHQETAAATPTPATAASPAATASPASAPSPTAPAAPPADVAEAERQIWDALKRKDWDAFAALLAEDQLEVAPDGVYTRAQSVELVKQFDFSTAALSDFRELKLGPDASVHTYLVKGAGAGWPPNGMRHTTVWVKRDGRWRAALHQATILER